MSTNGIQMQFLGAVVFKSSTLTVYCLSSCFLTKKFYHIHICVSFVDSVINHDFRNSNIVHPIFGLPFGLLAINHNVK